jgi:WD40 repeat protein
VTTRDAPAARTQLSPRWQHGVGDYVAAAEITGDGRLCIVASGVGTICGVEVATGRELFRVRAHDGAVLKVSLSPDGARFVTCGQGPTAKVWSAAGDLLHELPGGGSSWVEHVAWAPDGGRIAVAAGRIVRVWSPEGAPLTEALPLASTASGLAWGVNGAELAASCYGGVHLWAFAKGAVPRHLAWKGSLISLAWSPDAKVLACASQDSSVHFWRLPVGQASEMSGYPMKPKALAWDAESKLLATTGGITVTLWDFRGRGPEGSRPIELEGHMGVCTCLAFSPRKGVLASGGQDAGVLLWEPRRGTRPTRFAFLDDEVTALVWHPEHRGLLGGDAAGNLTFWEAG